MHENVLLSSISIDKLLIEVRTIFTELIHQENETKNNSQLLSPKETCKLFSPQISLTTLRKWTDEGHLKEYRVGSRVFYKYGEVVNRPAHLNRYKLKNL